MTDYTRGTGSSGTMLIRDLGQTVEFWINANNSTTWSDHIPWGWTVPWASASGTFYYHPNSAWQRITTIQVGQSANVTFHLGATGTSGFGGPTDFTVFLNRATIPQTPSAPTFSSITATSARMAFGWFGDGGSPITTWRMDYGTDLVVGRQTVLSFDAVVSGLTPGSTYYCDAIVLNGVGYSNWSAISTFTTLDVPQATTTPTLSNVGPVSVDVTWVPNGNGGSAITGFQVGYGTDPSAPTSTVAAVSPQTVTGLIPGTKYYFWTRAGNSVGWGPWSASANATTVAGARIKVSGVWKVAVPYVRDGGVWKIAHPYVKDAGVWKETV